jgi:hypothetical protein
MRGPTLTFPAAFGPAERAGALVARPGDELTFHGWLSAARPHLCVLTDGSGRSERGRLLFTNRILGEVGARRGSVFGLFADRELYGMLLARRHDPLLRLIERLVVEFRLAGIDYLVTTAAEGYTPAHDVCRLVAERVACQLGIPLYEALISPRREVGRPTPPTAIRALLGECDLEAKLTAGREYTPIEVEVSATLAWCGRRRLAEETLYPTEPASVEELLPVRPYYEDYGTQQVARGVYAEVIRREEHLVPLAEHVELARARRAA